MNGFGNANTVAYRNFIKDPNFKRFVVLSKRYHRINPDDKIALQEMKSRMDPVAFSLRAGHDIPLVRKGAERTVEMASLKASGLVIAVFGLFGITVIKTLNWMMNERMNVETLNRMMAERIPNFDKLNMLVDVINRNVLEPIGCHVSTMGLIAGAGIAVVFGILGVALHSIQKNETNARLILNKIKE